MSQVSLSYCLLFDSDGTLVDSERISSDALAIKFKELGVELDADDLSEKYRGWKLSEIIDLLVSEHEVDIQQDFVESYRQVVSRLFESGLQPVKHVKAALESFDLPMAVVTNGPGEKVFQALKVCGLSEYFGANVFSAYDISVWKPDPGIYLHAAKKMGFAPEKCIVIEDGLVGVEAAIKAGMKTLFYSPANMDSGFREAISFDSMAKLPGLINSIVSSA